MNAKSYTIENFTVETRKVAGQKSWVLIHKPTNRMVAGSTEKKTLSELFNNWSKGR